MNGSPQSAQPAPEAEARAVAVTGFGVVCPLGVNDEEFTASLVSGRKTFAPVTRFPTERYTVNRASEVPEAWFRRKDDKTVGSPPARLLQDAADQALGAARLAPPLPDLALVLGTTLGSDELPRVVWQEVHGHEPDYDALVSGMRDTTGMRLAKQLRIGGPVYPVVTACAAGTTAIGIGADLIRTGSARRVLAGGVDTLIELIYAGFDGMGALAQECRPFAADREGVVLAEGAALVVLEPLHDALRRGATVHALVLGSGLANDAHHPTAPHPDGLGAALAISRCLHDAGLSPEAVDYVNAHGTGTIANDPAEVAALRRVFGKSLDRVTVSSTKSQMGHALSAAGAIEFLATLHAVRDGVLPPTAHSHAPIDRRVDFVQAAGRRAAVKCALSNSFAFGGHTATIALGAWCGDE